MPLNRLLSALEALLAAVPGRVAVAVEHLTTGERFRLHDDAPMPAASVIKLHLAIAAYQAVERGELALLERVAVPALALDDEAEWDNLGLAPAGARHTWRKVIDRMLTESDNAATNALIDRLGLDALAPLTARLGLRATALRRRMLDVEARSAGRENMATAEETVRVLAALQRGELLDPVHTAELLAVLGQQRDRDKLAAGLPAEAAFAHKTGELPGYRHDAGLVHFSTPEAAWAICVLAEGDGPATDALLARVATLVDAHQRARRADFEQAEAWLAAEKARLLGDPRLGWDTLRLGWEAGEIVLSGATTLPERLAPPPFVRVEATLLAGRPGVVRVPCLQLRRGPGHAQELVSQVRLGDPLTLLEEGPDWTLLRSADGYLAYGKSNNLLGEQAYEPTHVVAVPLATAICEDGRVLQLSAGSRLVATEEPDRWRLPSAAGEVHARLAPEAVRPLGAQGDVEGVLALARGFLGLPYLWGGTTGWGIDCSGLAQLAYFVQGVALPRDADQQQEATEAVSREALEPGDLVFFPGHVGLYLGGGAFLHASAQAGCVTINSFDRADARHDPWLDENFSGGGRSPLRAPLPSGAPRA